jgi:hypothetical protein
MNLIRKLAKQAAGGTREMRLESISKETHSSERRERVSAYFVSVPNFVFSMKKI